jgi:hypothetical protein
MHSQSLPYEGILFGKLGFFLLIFYLALVFLLNSSTGLENVSPRSSRFFIALNGSLAGYFEGRKGLHQGDSVSLFVCSCYGSFFKADGRICC